MQTNVIQNMDCMEGMKDLPDKSIDMILCDLPYGITKNDWDVPLPLDELWEHYRRIVKDDGCIVLTSMQPFTTDLINAARDIFKFQWIWEKSKSSGFLNANRFPLRCHEEILVFGKRQPCYNPQKTKGHPTKRALRDSQSLNYGEIGSNYYESDERYPRSVFKIKQDDDVYHPTQKPVELFEYLILTHSNPGDIVLDNCIGSGTTALACIWTDRKYIGYELNHDYYDIAMERVRVEGIRRKDADKQRTIIDFELASAGGVQ